MAMETGYSVCFCALVEYHLFTERLMGSTTLVSLDEYLHTTYRPDCDFLEGEVRERNMGEQPHAHIQGILAAIFRDHRREWNVRALPEQRVQVRPNRFRIPDVCVLRGTDPKDRIVRFAPLLCVEILSSDQTMRDMRERAVDYSAFGVEHVWAVDPWKRLGFIWNDEDFRQSPDGVLRIPATPIAVSLAEIFAELDEE